MLFLYILIYNITIDLVIHNLFYYISCSIIFGVRVMILIITYSYIRTRVLNATRFKTYKFDISNISKIKLTLAPFYRSVPLQKTYWYAV